MKQGGTPMIQIAFVVPDSVLVDVVRRAWDLHDSLFGRNEELQYTVDYEIMPDKIMKDHGDADVIVCRGGTAAALKKKNLLRPIVEIPITISDIVVSVRRAIKQYGESPIGAVGTINTIRSLYLSRYKFPVSVKPYPTASVEIDDLIVGMERAVKDGCGIILAGHNTCNYCREHGIPAGLIYSSIESVFLAITEAKSCAHTAMVEKENSMISRSIVDNVFEGIITVDQDDLIRTFNPAASEILNIEATQCIGQPVRKVFPDNRISAILSGGQSYTNEIVRIMGENYVVNSTPMAHEGKSLGTLIAFQAAQTISNTESRIRDRLRVSGHIAKHRFEDILGESQAVQYAIHQAKRFAHVDSNVLLYGETGTGKELFAQSIHKESRWASGPFVAVNCAAIPENLMESELFGYEPGAFTGAVKTGKAGLFEVAHEGTIFLDEISELSLPLQSRLLRVIQEREIRRVGANRVIPINVRIISATNRDLNEMIKKGKFREDLYYRLKVLSVDLPPVRERKSDVRLLMQYFIDYYAKKFGKGKINLSDEAEQVASAYDWPGNIREIRNISEQLVVLCETDTITYAEVRAVVPVKKSAENEQPETIQAKAERLADLEKQKIAEVLLSSRTKKEAAEKLGISKTTLWRRCKELGLNN
jgi:transcriptional regulator with PAS, ATPase and Fis domain